MSKMKKEVETCEGICESSDKVVCTGRLYYLGRESG